ncbi:MAG: hypothetical protein A4S16_10230 [Proteobacteria bacterium SG_bin6]|nr:MAG: hypothetical protein A4S16_10230 [Proteobacteria bacterium SG_bin6]
MDLSFPRFEPVEVLRSPPPLAILLAATAARQAASVTARSAAQAALGTSAPIGTGAFNANAARTLIAWQDT